MVSPLLPPEVPPLSVAKPVVATSSSDAARLDRMVRFDRPARLGAIMDGVGTARVEIAMRPRDMIESFILEALVMCNECGGMKRKTGGRCEKEWKSCAEKSQQEVTWLSYVFRIVCLRTR